MTQPGFQDWLNARGSMLFQDWATKEIFTTTEVFITMLGKMNYHYAIAHLNPPLPEGFSKGRFLWNRKEAETLWAWAFENGWFTKLS
jgi:hypothetical protein